MQLLGKHFIVWILDKYWQTLSEKLLIQKFTNDWIPRTPKYDKSTAMDPIE